jgi:hypothetical protein
MGIGLVMVTGMEITTGVKKYSKFKIQNSEFGIRHSFSKSVLKR